MKKIMSIILVLAMFCCAIPVSFAVENFDYTTVLGSRDGYEYNKFDKNWTYYQATVNTFSDARVIVGMTLYGDNKDSSNPGNPGLTSLYVKVLDRSGNPLRNVKSIDFLIGDDLYSYESMMEQNGQGSVMLRHIGQRLIEAIDKAAISDITVRIGTDRGSLTYEASEFDDFSSTLKEFCRVFVKYKIDDYYIENSEYDGYETLFPLKVNGETAK